MTRLISRADPAQAGWALTLLGAVVFPLVVANPYYLDVGILVMLYIALAVAFDLVVGRIGALSLAQPVFLGIGAYTAGILSSRMNLSFLPIAGISVVLAVAAAILIGIPAFRLSMHSFAMATLAFAVSGVLIAKNWSSVTGGTLCTTGVKPLRLDLMGFSFTPAGLAQLYYVALGIAVVSVAVVAWLSSRRFGLGMTAIRDDPILGSARGIWPNEIRIGIFALSAAMTSVVGAYMAHLQTVVCPNVMEMTYTVELLIIVFIGGRGSLRGVVTAAILFTTLPQFLRIAEEWRLVIYGALLVVIVTTAPDGIEHFYRQAAKLVRRVTGRGERNGTPSPAGPATKDAASPSTREAVEDVNSGAGSGGSR